MISSDFANFESETNSLRGYLETTHKLRAVLPGVLRGSEPNILEFDLWDISKTAPNSTRWRVMEHSLVIGRLYALYESYCERLLGNWVEFLTNSHRYSELPKKVKDGYSRGFSTIVGMLPSPRYPDLKMENLVSGFNSALQGEESYYLAPECLTHHKNNLRLDELREIFTRCGVEGLEDWFAGNPSLLNFFSNSPSRILDQISSKLVNFIQYRNDSAHGSVATDEILGFEELIEQIDFIYALAKSLDELISWKALEIQLDKGEAKLAGKITEVFKGANACILLTEEVELAVGQELQVKKAGSFRTDQISSMMLDNTTTNRHIAKSGTKIGLQLNLLPAKGSEIYIVNHE